MRNEIRENFPYFSSYIFIELFKLEFTLFMLHNMNWKSVCRLMFNVRLFQEKTLLRRRLVLPKIEK